MAQKPYTESPLALFNRFRPIFREIELRPNAFGGSEGFGGLGSGRLFLYPWFKTAEKVVPGYGRSLHKTKPWISVQEARLKLRLEFDPDDKTYIAEQFSKSLWPTVKQFFAPTTFYIDPVRDLVLEDFIGDDHTFGNDLSARLSNCGRIPKGVFEFPCEDRVEGWNAFIPFGTAEYGLIEAACEDWKDVLNERVKAATADLVA